MEDRVAQKRVLVMEDDLDGGPAGNTLRFSLEGDEYEIDLNDANARTMRGAFAPYVERGRKVNRRRSYARQDGPVDNRTVRAWAAANGIEMHGRGRIPARVMDQYRAAGV